MERKVEKTVKGFRTRDGAGVSLVRVLGRDTVEDFDPILMLDSFDSTNPEDYIKGFPPHPHRGIETISYLRKGKMTHKDSLGNEDTISDGEVQWMTAGSGIIHSEALPESEMLLGVQLWLNLPKKDKMARPHYQAIRAEEIEEIEIDGGSIRLLAGTYKDHEGYMSAYLPLDYYDIGIDKGRKVTIESERDKSISIFTLLGSVEIGGTRLEEKTAAKLSLGDKTIIRAEEDARVLFISSDRLDEPVAWAGPIVMNTREELRQASLDLKDGSFVKDSIVFDDK